MSALPQPSRPPASTADNTAHRGASAAIDLGNLDSLDCYTAKQRRTAIARAQCVLAFERKKSEMLGSGVHQADWIDSFCSQLQAEHAGTLKSVTRSNLYRWVSRYKSGGVEQLIDQRGGDVRSQGEAPCWAYFESIYLDPREPSVKSCHQRTLEWSRRHGFKWCSLASCRRQLAAGDRISEIKQVKHRQPLVYRSKYKPRIAQAVDRYLAGKCWVGDHAQLDFFVALPDGKLIRPFLTAWMDQRTRRITGHMLCILPSSGTIMTALKRGLKDPANKGGPSEVIIDNGKDYDAWVWDGQTKQQRRKRVSKQVRIADEGEFTGVFGLLGIEPHYSIAYNPDGKSWLERWFGTLHDQFDKSMPTYCGNKPGAAPENLQGILKDRRNVPTFAQAQARLQEYIRGYNASADHQRDATFDTETQTRLSPDAAIQRWCDTRIHRDSDVIDHICQIWTPPRRVGKEGVSIRVAGMKMSYGWVNESLRALPRKAKVYVAYDPDDLSSVRVYDTKLRLITEAKLNTQGGLPGANRHQVREAMREKRHFEKALQTLSKNRELAYLSDMEILADQLDQVEQASSLQPPDALKFPPGGQTPFDAPSNPDRQPNEMQQAVGAEFDPEPGAGDENGGEDQIDIFKLDLGGAPRDFDRADDDDDLSELDIFKLNLNPDTDPDADTDVNASNEADTFGSILEDLR